MIAAAADYTGAWRGEFLLTTCQGDRHCFAVVDKPRPYELRLDQVGSRVTGVLASETFAGRFVVDVAGDIGANGGVRLTGAAERPSDRDYIGPVSATVEIEPGTDVLVGRIQYRLTAPLLLAPIVYGGPLRSSERSLLSADASGMWSGLYVITDCAPMQHRGCQPSTVGAIERFESTVSGTTDISADVDLYFWAGRLDGSFVNSTLSLSGRLDRKAAARVTGWSSVVDRFGVMTGGFTFEDSDGVRYDAKLARVLRKH